jgi:hypothetical protein
VADRIDEEGVTVEVLADRPDALDRTFGASQLTAGPHRTRDQLRRSGRVLERSWWRTTSAIFRIRLRGGRFSRQACAPAPEAFVLEPEIGTALLLRQLRPGNDAPRALLQVEGLLAAEFEERAQGLPQEVGDHLSLHLAFLRQLAASLAKKTLGPFPVRTMAEEVASQIPARRRDVGTRR